jgi:hypothetical protein
MESEIDIIWRYLTSNEQRVFFAIARYSGESFSRILQLKASDVYYCEATPREKIRFTERDKTYLFTIPEILRCILVSTPIRINIPENKYLFPHKIKPNEHLAVSNANIWISNACTRAYKNGSDISPKYLKIYILRELYRNGMSLKDCKKLFTRCTNQMLSIRIANSDQSFEQILKNENVTLSKVQ